MITPETIAKAGTEHAHQAALFCWAALNSDKYPELRRCMFAIPNGGERNIIVASKMVAEGARKGTSDLMVAVPRAIYHGLFIEMKKPGEKKKESVEQKAFGAAVKEQGYYYECCDHWELASSLITWYMNGCSL